MEGSHFFHCIKKLPIAVLFVLLFLNQEICLRFLALDSGHDATLVLHSTEFEVPDALPCTSSLPLL